MVYTFVSSDVGQRLHQTIGCPFIRVDGHFLAVCAADIIVYSILLIMGSNVAAILSGTSSMYPSAGVMEVSTMPSIHNSCVVALPLSCEF